VGDRLVRPWLITALQDEHDDPVRAELISALSRVSDSSHIGLLSRFLADPDPRVQANALDGLERIGSLEIIPHIRPLLYSLDNRVKANAAKALFGQGELDVVKELQGMLDSATEGERLSAIFALGEIGLALHSLTDTHRYYLLASALAESETKEVRRSPKERPFSLSDSSHVGQFADEHFDLLMAHASGDLKKALELVEPVLKLHPAHPIGQFIKGEIYRLWEDYEKSAEHLMAAESFDGSFLGVLMSLASLHNSRGQTKDSVVYYLKTLREKLSLLSGEVDFALGLVKSDRLADASLLLKSLISQIHFEPRTHHHVGCQAIRYGDLEKAFRHLFLAFVTDPRDKDTARELAQVAASLGHTRLAERLLNYVEETLDSTRDSKLNRPAAL